MADEYTPTTDEMLDGYRAMRAREIPGDRLMASVQALDGARRWLAEHDRQVRAEAWDACRSIVADRHPHCSDECPLCDARDEMLDEIDAANPYTEAADD